MRRRIVVTSAIAVALGLWGCQKVLDQDGSHVKAEIEAQVGQASKAYESFPKSLDRTSIMKYYAADYTGIKDGALETLKDLEKMFDDLAEQIKLGDPIGVSYKITNLKIEALTDRLAWMTYQDEAKWGRGGAVLRDDKTRCSTLLRREGETWLVFHEHCSTVSGERVPGLVEN